MLYIHSRCPVPACQVVVGSSRHGGVLSCPTCLIWAGKHSNVWGHASNCQGAEPFPVPSWAGKGRAVYMSHMQLGSCPRNRQEGSHQGGKPQNSLCAWPHVIDIQKSQTQSEYYIYTVLCLQVGGWPFSWEVKEAHRHTEWKGVSSQPGSITKEAWQREGDRQAGMKAKRVGSCLQVGRGCYVCRHSGEEGWGRHSNPGPSRRLGRKLGSLHQVLMSLGNQVPSMPQKHSSKAWEAGYRQARM